MTQPNFCQNCGVPLKPDTRFCENCGHPVGAPPNAPTTLPEDSPSVQRKIPETAPNPHVPTTLPEASASAHINAGRDERSVFANNSRGLIIAGILLGGLLLVGILFILFGLLNPQTPKPAQYAVILPTPSATNLPVPTSIAEQNALPAVPTLSSIAPLTAVPMTSIASTDTAQIPTLTWTPPAVTATATPAVTRVPRATMPIGMLFEEDFGSQEILLENGWTVGDDEKWNHTWAPNQYILTSKTKGYLALDYPQPMFDDAGIQIEGQLASGDYAQYGIALRVNDAEGNVSGYLYGITTDGLYYLAQMVDNAWIQPLLVPYTASPDIKTGNSKNRLSVLVEGDTLRLYINGTLVRIVTDPSISGKGHAGVFVYSGNHDNAQAAFSRIAVLDAGKAESVWAPPSTLATPSPEATFVAVQPTPVPPTATRRPPTPKSSPTSFPYGGLLFADGFTGNYAGWSEGTDTQGERYFENGQYHLIVKAARSTLVANPGAPVQASDFVAEARVTALDGPPENAAGLVFRRQNAGNYYIFRVSPNGGFAFARYRDGQYERITNDEWIFPSAIYDGYASNLIRVHARGDLFTLYINDVEVGSFRDGAYSSGDIGIAASVWDNTGSHFAFDDVRVWDNSASQTAPPPQAQPPNTITVFFSIQNGAPAGYVIDKQGVRHDGSVQAAISGISIAPGDRIVLQTDAPRFSLMFDCSTEPQAFSPCDFSADSPTGLPGEIRVKRNGALAFINLSRADNWGDLRPGHEPQRYPADPVLRIVLGN